MAARRDGPIRVAVINDYEVIVAGITTLLAPFPDRVVVVERLSRLAPVTDVDVVLHDTFSRVQGAELDLDEILGDSQAKVVVYSWNDDAALIAQSLARGAAGYILKSAGADEVVSMIERIADGELVRPVGSTAPAQHVAGQPAWPGQDAGLTARESEVVALITQGFSNQEIADRCYLSINSIKTYIRTGYRKMGVTRRADAVRWGIEHGLVPDTVRRVGPQA